MPCDNCDPSFSCFGGISPCRKVPLHPDPRGAELYVRMALNCLEELEPTAMNRKRRMVRNFNEHAERESQLSAARVSLDRALDLLQPKP